MDTQPERTLAWFRGDFPLFLPWLHLFVSKLKLLPLSRVWFTCCPNLLAFRNALLAGCCIRQKNRKGACLLEHDQKRRAAAEEARRPV